jgi:hypothetical protein
MKGATMAAKKKKKTTGTGTINKNAQSQLEKLEEERKRANEAARRLRAQIKRSSGGSRRA